jgi:hypothetical protein
MIFVGMLLWENEVMACQALFFGYGLSVVDTIPQNLLG